MFRKGNGRGKTGPLESTAEAEVNEHILIGRPVDAKLTRWLAGIYRIFKKGYGNLAGADNTAGILEKSCVKPFAEKNNMNTTNKIIEYFLVSGIRLSFPLLSVSLNKTK